MDIQPTIDYEKEADRARWHKNDLDSGTGWTKRLDIPGEFILWSKTFPDRRCPTVCLYKFLNVPIPYEKFAKMIDPSDMQLRKKWDEAFGGFNILSEYPDGAVTYQAFREMSWPIADRDWILHLTPTKEIDWFGKKATMELWKDVSDTSTFVSSNAYVRANNGGNFMVITAHDENPETESQRFGLSSNVYNGWMPNTGIEWLIGRGTAKAFHELRQSMVDGYNKYYKKDDVAA